MNNLRKVIYIIHRLYRLYIRPIYKSLFTEKGSNTKTQQRKHKYKQTIRKQQKYGDQAYHQYALVYKQCCFC